MRTHEGGDVGGDASGIAFAAAEEEPSVGRLAPVAHDEAAVGRRLAAGKDCVAGGAERLGRNDEAVETEHAAAREPLEAAGASVGRHDDVVGADIARRCVHDGRLFVPQRKRRRPLVDRRAEQTCRARKPEGEPVRIEMTRRRCLGWRRRIAPSRSPRPSRRDRADAPDRSRSARAARATSSAASGISAALCCVSMMPARRSHEIAKRTINPRTSAFASSAMFQNSRARLRPKCCSSQITSRRRPEWICPPFRPEAPLATRSASMSTTSAPASARWIAAERPVKPPPTIRTSALREPSSGGYSGGVARREPVRRTAGRRAPSA